jgi:hypothetical protein
MTRRTSFAGIVDILRAGDAETILALSREGRLDRDLDGAGPILNRTIMRRIRAAFSLDGRPFSAVTPRGDVERRDRQARLEAEIAARLAAGLPAPGQLDALAAYVRGETAGDSVGPVAQQAVGLLFSDRYVSTLDTWKAACTLDAAPRTLNPIRRIRWALTNALGKAQAELGRGVDGDPSGMHATGVAVHSLVRSLEAMRALWADPAIRAATTPENAAFRSLRAPVSVPRRCGALAMTAAGELRGGTLVLLDLEAARERSPGPETTFLAGSWSQCPAHAWVPALLRAVWARASGADSGEAGAEAGR